MIDLSFPKAQFCNPITRRFLDTIEYDDNNLTREERISGLREVHAKTADYFTQPLPREALEDIHPVRTPTVCHTISSLVVYCWPYVPRDVRADVTIWMSIINVLDDETSSDPASNTPTLLTDMLAGRPPSYPFRKPMQAHLPTLLAHFGSFCGFKIVRRLSTLGGAVAGTLSPTSRGFDDQALFKEISIVMGQIYGIIALQNGLFSFYREFDQAEPNLVSNIGGVEGITMEQALETLTNYTTYSCVLSLELLADKDAAVRQSISIFIHSYVTWHLCELRRFGWVCAYGGMGSAREPKGAAD